MTLREKFKTKVSINTEGEAGRFANKCEQIADDYAIEFAKWYDESNYGIEVYKHLKTYEQVLEIFKKEIEKL